MVAHFYYILGWGVYVLSPGKQFPYEGLEFTCKQKVPIDYSHAPIA